MASYKAIEFHGCEIDYNTTKSGLAEANNVEGAQHKYNIDIFFDEAYEIRFNEFLGNVVTDIVGDNSYSKTELGTLDRAEVTIPKSPKYEAPPEPKEVEPVNDGGVLGRAFNDYFTGLSKKAGLETLSGPRPNIFEPGRMRVPTEGYLGSAVGESVNGVISKADKYVSGFTSLLRGEKNQNGFTRQRIFGDYESSSNDLVAQLTSGIRNKIQTKVNHLYLGNINGFSFDRLKRTMEQAGQGDIMGTYQRIKSSLQEPYNGLTVGESPGNLFEDADVSPLKILQLGNIFETRSIINQTI